MGKVAAGAAGPIYLSCLMTRLLLIAAALFGCFVALPAQAQFGGQPHLRPALVSETDTVVAGKPFTIGVWLKMDPGWHTYWQFPGTGFPLTAEWKLPPGFTAGPIQWPLPQAEYDKDLEETSYIYMDEVLLLVEITPPADLPAGGIDLNAALKWQVCEKICIPGGGPVSLHLESGPATTPSKDAAPIAKWRAQLPQTTAPFPVTWDSSNPKQLRLTLGKMPGDGKVEFFPLPPLGQRLKDPVVSPAQENGERMVTIALPKAKPATKPWRGVVVQETPDGKREGWLVTAPGAAAPPPAVPAATPAPSSASAPPPQAGPVGPETRSLSSILPLAFFGGLILNVMPCVLPVIALKIFGFMRQAGHEPRRIFRLGLAFIAGVFTFFLLLALAVIQPEGALGFSVPESLPARGPHCPGVCFRAQSPGGFRDHSGEQRDLRAE